MCYSTYDIDTPINTHQYIHFTSSLETVHIFRVHTMSPNTETLHYGGHVLQSISVTTLPQAANGYWVMYSIQNPVQMNTA